MKPYAKDQHAKRLLNRYNYLKTIKNSLKMRYGSMHTIQGFMKSFSKYFKLIIHGKAQSLIIFKV